MNSDGVDRVLLREAAAIGTPRPLVVVDDRTGALIAGLNPEIAYDDFLPYERVCRAEGAPPEIWRAALDDAALSHARLVVTRVPQASAALDELAEAVARHADPSVTLVAAGLDRHLSRSMNAVLERHFSDVRGSLGLGKARALVATGARPGPITYPRRARVEALDLEVCAHGAAFSGTRLDAGTKLLLSALKRSAMDSTPDAASRLRIADLGCGTGILASVVARRHPDAEVWAVDASRAAVASARATVAANGLSDRVHVALAGGLEDLPELDAVVCNPPFHRGTAKDSSDAYRMIADAARSLRPYGELWLVYNAHLPYLTDLRRRVGPTRVIARDRAYVVTRSIRREAASPAAAARERP